MRRYETIVILDPDLIENDRTVLIERIKEIIPQQQGVFLQEDIWGLKKLAYDIKKKPRGYYVRFDYCGFGPAVDELERFCKIDDRVMKFMTVQLESEADIEKIKEQIAAAKVKAPEAPSTPNEAVASDDRSVDQDDDEDADDDSDEETETDAESQEE